MSDSGTGGRRAGYFDWNGAIATVVYPPQAADTPTFLDLEDDVLRSVADAAGEDTDDPRSSLVQAVRATLNPASHQAGMFGRHVFQLLRWRSSSGEPPPVLALLGVLCLAAEDMVEGDGFAANNYYDRLMPLLEVQSPAAKELVIKAYRKCSRELWESLNGWLVDLHGKRGLPTAYSYTLAHVGRPMSQALIRATDREKLGEFFAELGVPPRTRVSLRDMDLLLGEWIGRNPSPASVTLRGLWQRSGARERISEIASQLLETWDGPSVEPPNPGQAPRPGRFRQLSLIALLRSFPAPALELNITGPKLEEQSDSPLEFLDHRLEATQGPELAVEQLAGSRWRLSDPGQLDAGSLLGGRLSLRHPSGIVMDRRPRSVVPLTKDHLLQAFVEVERLPLGEDSVILCKQELAQTVGGALTTVARIGFKQWDVSLAGLPGGWVLFSDVQILAGLPATDKAGSPWRIELNALQPLASSQLLLEGGLQLPGRLRRWSSLAAPEVRVATEEAATLVVAIEQTRALGRNVPSVELSFDEPAAILPLQPLSLTDGDYEIAAAARTTTSTGATKSHSLGVVRLRLRSGDTPDPAPVPDPALCRAFVNPGLATLTASRSSEEGPEARGPITSAPGDTPQPSSVSLRAPFHVPPWWVRRRSPSPRQPQRAVEERIFVPAAAVDDCFRTGAHFIELPTYYGKPTRSSIEGVCRQCGLVKRYPGWLRFGAPPPTTTTATRTVPTTAPRLDLNAVEAIPTAAISPNVALDALSHDRVGTAAGFEQLALQIEPSRLFTDRFLRGLEALGHVEVSRDPRTFAAIEWEIVSPALVEIADGGFVLTGHRSRSLVDAVTSAARQLGLEVERRQQDIGPERVRVLDCTAAQANEIAGRACRPTPELEIAVVLRAAHELARLLPPLSEAIGAIPRQAMVGFRSANRWDADVARWVGAGDASSPGAYQLFGATTTYCLREALDIDQGTMRRTDARLVKHGAALLRGEPLIGYDADTGWLYLPLGAELPGLYGRVAGLSSGLLPVDDEQQRIVRYPSVPLDLAEHLAALLAC